MGCCCCCCSLAVLLLLLLSLLGESSAAQPGVRRANSLEEQGRAGQGGDERLGLHTCMHSDVPAGVQELKRDRERGSPTSLTRDGSAARQPESRARGELAGWRGDCALSVRQPQQHLVSRADWRHHQGTVSSAGSCSLCPPGTFLAAAVWMPCGLKEQS